MNFYFKAMWTYKCPKCRSESSELFVKPFKFSEPLNMHKHCEVCGQNFEPEPGYYYGAMFLSYIISSFLLLSLALILVFYFGWTVESAMIVVILVGLGLFFRILRTSRALWIHAMVKYDASLKR